MEVYLNIAETGIGTYGANAGAMRYFNHDAASMTRTEAARIAAVLPLPKQRGATAPKGFTRRYGNAIASRIGVVAREGLDGCVYSGASSAAEEPVERIAPRPKRTAPLPSPATERRPATPALPGEEYEQLPPQVEPEPEPAGTAPEQAPMPEVNGL
jgi:monofunctional biosynthetic peptidoglycan transglycosylase